MARKLDKSIQNIAGRLLTSPRRKYYVTLGLRSMKWDEWIGESFFDSQFSAAH